jgi:hypothetical protein
MPPPATPAHLTPEAIRETVRNIVNEVVATMSPPPSDENEAPPSPPSSMTEDEVREIVMKMVDEGEISKVGKQGPRGPKGTGVDLSKIGVADVKYLGEGKWEVVTEAGECGVVSFDG